LSSNERVSEVGVQGLQLEPSPDVKAYLSVILGLGRYRNRDGKNLDNTGKNDTDADSDPEGREEKSCGFSRLIFLLKDLILSLTISH
jgi:hypothetical protein